MAGGVSLIWHSYTFRKYRPIDVIAGRLVLGGITLASSNE